MTSERTTAGNTITTDETETSSSSDEYTYEKTTNYADGTDTKTVTRDRLLDWRDDLERDHWRVFRNVRAGTAPKTSPRMVSAEIPTL